MILERARDTDGKAIAYQQLKYRELCEIRLLTFTGEPGQSATKDELLATCGKNSASSRLSWAPDGKSILFESVTKIMRSEWQSFHWILHHSVKHN